MHLPFSDRLSIFLTFFNLWRRFHDKINTIFVFRFNILYEHAMGYQNMRSDLQNIWFLGFYCQKFESLQESRKYILKKHYLRRKSSTFWYKNFTIFFLCALSDTQKAYKCTLSDRKYSNRNSNLKQHDWKTSYTKVNAPSISAINNYTY